MRSPRVVLLAMTLLAGVAAAAALGQTGLPGAKPGGVDPTPAAGPDVPTTMPRLPGAPGVPAEMPVSPGNTPTTMPRATSTVPPAMLPTTTLPAVPGVATTLPGMR